VNPNIITPDPWNLLQAIAVNSAGVYWASLVPGCGIVGCWEESWIGRANLDGTDVKQDFITAGIGDPRGVAVDGAHVYWTSQACLAPGCPADIGPRLPQPS
jgi:hypothetical protein